MNENEKMLANMLNEAGLSMGILNTLNQLRIPDTKGFISERIFNFAELFATHQTAAALKDMEAELAEKDGEVANHIEIFKWLLGHYDFPEPPTEGRPRYYWRAHLQAKLKEIGVNIEGVQSPFQPRETDKTD